LVSTEREIEPEIGTIASVGLAGSLASGTGQGPDSSGHDGAASAEAGDGCPVLGGVRSRAEQRPLCALQWAYAHLIVRL
jgi:hypothetical protein